MKRFIELQGRQAHQPGLRLQVPQRVLALALALALVLAWALLPQVQALQRQEFRL
jgi:type VI protein secretion system component VasF